TLEDSHVSPDEDVGEPESSDEGGGEVLSPRNFDGMRMEEMQGDCTTSSAIWVDLATSECESPVLTGEPCVEIMSSESVSELGEPSLEVCLFEPEVDDVIPVVELPLTVVEEPVDDFGSPIQCAPLMMMLPSGPMEGSSEPPLEPSVWVKQRHKGFCKLVGFPIDCHEQECLALLQKIEAYRFAKKEKEGARRRNVSGKKGSRELRRLVSSVNYDGRQPVC
ncbi:hypothetical protein FCV25MIE_24710, partial [Fagus crenata]